MNSSNSSLVEPFSENYWIISEIIIVFATLTDLYILFSLSVYLRKIRRNTKMKQLKQLLWFNLVTTLLILGRLTADQVAAFVGWKSDDFCFYSVSVSSVLYTLSVTPVYLFLWKRQHAFYTNKQLQTVKNKKLVFLSYAGVVILLISGISLTALYVTPSVTGYTYEATVDGCRDTNIQEFDVVPLTVYIVSGLGQIWLLCLLIYPLLKCRQPASSSSSKRRKRTTDDDKNQPSNSKTTQPHQLADSDSVFAGDTRSAQPSINEDVVGVENDAEQQRPSTPKLVNHTSPYHTNRHIQAPWEKRLGHQKADSIGSVKSIIASRMHHNGTPNKTPKKSRSKKRREKKIYRLIKKVFFLALICVLTDLVVTILQLAIDEPELVYLAFYDVNLITNAICITCSFEKWDIILRPWKERRSSSSRQRSSSAASHVSLQTLTSRVGTLERLVSTFNRSRKRTTTSVSSISTSRPATPDVGNSASAHDDAGPSQSSSR